MKQKIIQVILIAILFFSVLYLFAGHIRMNKDQLAEKGRIDLSQWNFDKDGTVNLNGEWEYYDGQLLKPEDFNGRGKQIPRLTGYADLTSSRRIFSDEKLPNNKGSRTLILLLQ